MESQNGNSIPLILITGANGQLGWELKRSMAPLGRVVCVGRELLDLSNEKNIRTFIQKKKPSVIINAAAYTAVDKAEEETVLAYKINTEAPRIMAEEAKCLNALFVHYSTDYVFNGEKETAYIEADEVSPLNVYGESKLAGENAVKDVAGNYLILRTSWVFASRGHNFLLSMLRLATEREELNIVSDQMGAPTSARLIADVTSHIVYQARQEIFNKVFESGVFHLSSTGKTSWYGFATEIIRVAKLHAENPSFLVRGINPILTSEYPTPAQRPFNSLLSSNKLMERFGVNMASWDEQVELCIEEFYGV